MRMTSGDVIVILAAAFLAWGALDQRHRKRFERDAAREALDYARRAHPQPPYTAADAAAEWNRVAAAVSDDGWGPDADEPVPFVPSETADLRQWEAEYARWRLERLRRPEESDL